MIRIGIPCDFETYTDSRGQEASRYFLGADYIQSLLKVGAMPLMLPYGDINRIPELLSLVHGILIAGGDFDHPPEFYGESRSEKLGKLLPERSAFEQILLGSALDRHLPVLGVCGGMQLLNIQYGGTLYQDISEHPGASNHEQKGPKQEPSGDVLIEADSLLARLCGSEALPCNHTHHQTIKDLGAGLTASGKTADGVVEAIEDSSREFVLGVQWHPELLGDERQHKIYSGFVEAARKLIFVPED